MALFSKKEVQQPTFSSVADAFTYMLAYQMDKNEDPMVAATKANEFAEIYAKNMGLPQQIEPPANGVDKYIQMAEKVGNYCDKHPKAAELLVGAATFFAGIIAGKKIDNEVAPTPNLIAEPIDFNNLN